MKTTGAFCVLLFISSLVGVPNPSSDSTADQTKLIALENAWNQAQLHHDDRALDGLIPDTFVYTDYDGTVMNKAQFLADLKDPSYRATMIANENGFTNPCTTSLYSRICHAGVQNCEKRMSNS